MNAAVRPVTWLLSALVVAVAAGCEPKYRALIDAPPTIAEHFTDATGFTLALTAPADSLVVFSPAAVEILSAIGVGGRIAAIADLCDPPAGYEDAVVLPTQPDLSVALGQIALIRPNVVLADADLLPEPQALRKALGATPVLFLQYQSLDETLAGVRDLGRLAGAPESADRLATRLETLRRRLADTLGRNPEPAVILTQLTPPRALAGKHPLNDVLAAVGMRNAYAGKPGPAVDVSFEELKTSKPAYILVIGQDPNARDALLALDPALLVTPALARNRALGADPRRYLRPGPRYIEAWAELAALKDPEFPYRKLLEEAFQDE